MTFFEIAGIIRSGLICAAAAFAATVLAALAAAWVWERVSARKGRPHNAPRKPLRARLTEYLVTACLCAAFAGHAGKNQHKVLRFYEEQRAEMLARGVAEDSPEYLRVLRMIARAEARIARPEGRGGRDPGGGPPRGGPLPLTYGEWLAGRLALGLHAPPPDRLTPDQYAMGVACTGIAAPPQGWATNMPANAVVHGRWGGAYGVYEDCLRLEVPPPGDGWFKIGYDAPFPECLYFTTGPDGALVCFDGLPGDPGDPEAGRTVIAALAAPLSLATNISSRFWHCLSPSGGLATWENAALLRDTNLTVTAQAAWSCKTGAFAVRLSFSNTNAPLSAYAYALAAHAPGAAAGFRSCGTGEQTPLPAILAYCAANGTREAELRFTAFHRLDPGATGGDTDGDFLTDWEEVMLYGTNPALKNSDGDAWDDGVEIAGGTGPLNPDSDFDGAVDGDDPDPAAPYAGQDHADWLFCVINKLPPGTDLTADDDGDGWPDWLEGLFGTSPDSPNSYPRPDYHYHGDWKYRWFPVTVTLTNAASPPAVLWIGPLDGAGGYTRRVLLRDPGEWTVWLDRQQENGMHLFSLPGQEVGYTVTCADPGEFIQVRPPGGWPKPPLMRLTGDGGPTPPPWPPDIPGIRPAGGVGIPRVKLEPRVHCFHTMYEEFTATITGGFEGLTLWPDGQTGKTAKISPDLWLYPHILAVSFMPYPYPPGVLTVWDFAFLDYCSLLHYRSDCRRYWVTHLLHHWCPLCAAFHGHAHIDLFEEDGATGEKYCSVCGTGPLEEDGGPHCEWCGDDDRDCPKSDELCAIRASDGTVSFRSARRRGFPGELTLLDHRVAVPGPCCACPEHWAWYYSEDLKWYLDSVSGPVSVVGLDGSALGGEITQAPYVRGDAPSSSPRDARVIVRAQLEDAKAFFTNYVTVASTRVARNVNGDEQQSIEARLELMRTNGVDRVKVEREKLVPFYLFSDVLVDGDLILTVKGDMAARVWSGPTTNSTLLLTSDQTITNGLPHTFATKGDVTEVWVEFLGAGPGTISYGFVGEGDAEGINFTDTISIMAYEVIAEPVSLPSVTNAPAQFPIGSNVTYSVSVTPGAEITWEISDHDVLNFVDGNTGSTVTVAGTSVGVAKLTAHIKGLSEPPPEFNVKVTDLPYTDVWAFIVSNNVTAAWTPTAVSNLVNQANPEVSQFGIQLRVVGIIYTNNPSWYDITNTTWAHTNMGAVANPGNGLKVFFVNEINNGRTLGFNGSNCMAIATGTNIIKLGTTLAHETGHACGWRDIYSSRGNNTNVIIIDIFDAGIVKKEYMDTKDWGAGYYQNDLLHTNFITRLLMYGISHGNKGHVPHGDVYGIYRPRGSNQFIKGKVPIGLDNPNFTRQPKHTDYK